MYIVIVAGHDSTEDRFGQATTCAYAHAVQLAEVHNYKLTKSMQAACCVHVSSAGVLCGSFAVD